MSQVFQNKENVAKLNRLSISTVELPASVITIGASVGSMPTWDLTLTGFIFASVTNSGGAGIDSTVSIIASKQGIDAVQPDWKQY